METGGVIKAFLASVGFRADEASLKSALGRVSAFALGVKLVTAGLYAGMIKIASGEAETARQAERLRTSVQSFKELEYAAAAGGVGFDKVSAALDALVQKNPRLRDSAQALEEVGRRLREQASAQRLVYAQRLGIDRELIPMLTSDLAGLRKEYQEMYAAAGADSKNSAAESRALTSELGKLSIMGKLLAQSLALPFIIKLREQLARLRRAILENYPRSSYIDWGPWAESIARVSGALKAALPYLKWLGVYFAASKASGGLFTFLRGLALAPGIIASLTKAVKALGLAIRLNPLGLLITGIAALIAYSDELKAFGAELNKTIDSYLKLQDFKTESGQTTVKTRDAEGNITGEVALPSFFTEIKGPGGLESAKRQSAGLNGPALAPGPAQAASISNQINNSREVRLQAETNIIVQAPDPVGAGRQVAAQQDRTNAELTRNLQKVVQ